MMKMKDIKTKKGTSRMIIATSKPIHIIKKTLSKLRHFLTFKTLLKPRKCQDAFSETQIPTFEAWRKRSFTQYIKELNPRHLLVYMVISFISGKGILFGSMFPFSVAFFAVMCTRKRRYALYALPIFAGIFSCHVSKFVLTKYFLIIGLLAIIYISFNKFFLKSTIKISAYNAFLFFIIAGIYQWVTEDILLYDIFLLVTEGIAIFTFTYLFSRLPALINKGLFRQGMSIDEIVCITSILAISMTTLANVVFFDLRIQYIVSFLIILLVTYHGNVPLGATIGVSMGAIIALNSYDSLSVIGLLGIAGIAAGFFSHFYRIINCSLWLSSMFVIMFYYNGFSDAYIFFLEGLSSCFLFLIIPTSKIDRFNNQLNDAFHKAKMYHFYGDKIRKMIIHSLKEYSETFENLAATYSRAYERSQTIEEEAVEEIVLKIKNRICNTCDFNKICWKGNQAKTDQVMKDMIYKTDKGIHIDADYIKHKKGFTCSHMDQIIFYIQSIVQAFIITNKWQKKLEGSREITASQFRGLAKSINHLIEEINEEQLFNIELEQKIFVRLKELRLPLLNVTVLEGDKSKNISLEIEKIEKIHYKNIEDIVSEELGEAYSIIKKTSDNKRRATMHILLRKKPNYKLITGTSKYAKEMNVCGDSHICMRLKNEHYLIALSDGMGSGEKAARESMLTINTLKHLLEADFDKELALKTMNSMLLLKSTEEIFSTVDITIINLETGQTSFYKIGAAAAFIKRTTGAVEVIKHSTLPIGIIDKIKIEEIETNVVEGDMIIMVSDGILDASPDDNKIKWIQKILKEINSKDPQTISDLVLNKAVAAYGDNERDDMTVITAKMSLSEKEEKSAKAG